VDRAQHLPDDRTPITLMEGRVAKELVVYMSPWCGNSLDTQRALTSWGVPCRYVNIKEDRAAAKRVREWTGFESVPTLVIAEDGAVEPSEPPAALAPGACPRGIDRGSMLTEPTRQQLQAWLEKNALK
jgi:glutaredoxin